MSRLKSRSSSKSERAIVKSVHEVLAIASVERSERSKIAISPKQAPGLRTASASSPDPGIVREMRTIFLSGPGDRAGDADLALGNNEEPVAGLAFLEDLLADGELLLPAHLGHAGQLAVVEVLEDRRLSQQIEVHADEAMAHRREGQVKPWVTRADLLTALRLPLAAAFPFVHPPEWQLALVGAAAASDFFDGMLARRFGESRAGAVLDPTADKVFMAAAFFTVARTGLLHPLEIVGVLARDIVAALGYVGAWLWRRPTRLPARAGGKAVTVLQLLTLVAFIARSPLVRPLAWATAAVGLYAIWDYGRAAARARATPTLGKEM